MRFVGIIATGALSLAAASADAATIYWTNWTSCSTNGSAVTCLGSITTPTSVVNVTYTNPRGIGFANLGNPGETDYWADASRVRNPATSPFTGSFVDNIPTGTDMIALQFAGLQTLTFSQTIATPVFAYISLNGNGYGFNRDFELLSSGGQGGRACGWWGCGTSSKNVAVVDGVTEYQLLGTGEPHGALRFTGAFDSVTWRSLSNEFWNGFTLGVQGTAAEVLPPSSVPEPATLGMLALGLLGAAFGRGRRSAERR